MTGIQAYLKKKVCLVSKLFPFHLSVYNVHSELDFHIPTAKYELIIAFSARYVRIAVFYLSHRHWYIFQPILDFRKSRYLSNYQIEIISFSPISVWIS